MLLHLMNLCGLYYYNNLCENGVDHNTPPHCQPRSPAHLDLVRALYALYGVKYIDLVSLCALFRPACHDPGNARRGRLIWGQH